MKEIAYYGWGYIEENPSYVRWMAEKVPKLTKGMIFKAVLKITTDGSLEEDDNTFMSVTPLEYKEGELYPEPPTKPRHWGDLRKLEEFYRPFIIKETKEIF